MLFTINKKNELKNAGNLEAFSNVVGNSTETVPLVAAPVGGEITTDQIAFLVNHYKETHLKQVCIAQNKANDTHYVDFSLTDLKTFISNMENPMIGADGIRFYFAAINNVFVNIHIQKQPQLAQCENHLTVIAVMTKKNTPDSPLSDELLTPDSLVMIPTLNGFDFGTLCPPNPYRHDNTPNQSIHKLSYGN
jgi:hypothetical protein